MDSHIAQSIPVLKMDSGSRPIAYRWKCSCSREGNGWHATEDKALKAAKDHVAKNNLS